MNFFKMFLNNYRRNYRGIYRRNEAGNFIFFITNGQKITDERFTDGAFPSAISSVN